MQGKRMRQWLLGTAMLASWGAWGEAENQGQNHDGIESIELPQHSPPAVSKAPEVLGDVVVTARRREERSLDVPVSMTVLDGDALGEAGLTLATDIQERVPGMVVSMPNARLTSYTIRGLGSTSANDGIESSVGLFLDGVYLGRQGLSIFDLIDLERVEVLRGPQGTLFGKNTTAGALNIVTRLPVDYYEAKLEVGMGNLRSRQLRGAVNDSLIDGVLSGRLTGYMSEREGTIHNIFNDSTINARDKHGFRGQLLWTPDPDFSGRLIAEFASNHEDCCAYPLTGPVRNAVVQRDAYMEYNRVGTDPAQRMTDSDTPTRSDMRQHAVSAEFNWDIGGQHRLTSLSAWRSWYFLPTNDDATSLHLASTSTENDHQQFSQEVRLSSSFEALDTVIGLFYIRQRLDGLERVVIGDDMVGWVFGGLLRENGLSFATESNTGPLLYAVIPPETLDGTTVDTDYFQTTDSMAAFASADWHIAERWDLSLGLRYTYEVKDSFVDRSRYGGDPDATVLAAPDPLLNLAAPVLEIAEPLINIIETAAGTQLPTGGWTGILDDIAGGEYQRATDYDEGDFSGKVSLSYKPWPDTTLFASAARGYKGGGINLGFTGESVDPTFRPEQATSFELGVKSYLFKKLASLSLTAYHTDIKDYQALTFDNEPTLLPNPRQINLLNVGRVRLQGAELEGYGYLAEGLVMRGGVAYSRAVTSVFPNAPNEDTRENDKDLSGEDLYNAPRWSVVLGGQYRFAFERGFDAYTGLDYMYRSGYWGTVEHGRASYIEAYDVVNLRLGLRAADRAWDVSLWARNLLDDDYIATVYPLYGVGDYGAVPADPVTYGLTVRVLLQ